MNFRELINTVYEGDVVPFDASRGRSRDRRFDTSEPSTIDMSKDGSHLVLALDYDYLDSTELLIKTSNYLLNWADNYGVRQERSVTQSGGSRVALFKFGPFETQFAARQFRRDATKVLNLFHIPDDLRDWGWS